MSVSFLVGEQHLHTRLINMKIMHIAKSWVVFYGISGKELIRWTNNGKESRPAEKCKIDPLSTDHIPSVQANSYAVSVPK
jgi:hypothetical protein